MLYIELLKLGSKICSNNINMIYQRRSSDDSGICISDNYSDIEVQNNQEYNYNDFELPIDYFEMTEHERNSVIQKTANQKFLQRLSTFCSVENIDYKKFDISIINNKEYINHLTEDEYIQIARDHNFGRYLYRNKHIFFDESNSYILSKLASYENSYVMNDCITSTIPKRTVGRPRLSQSGKQKQGKKTGKVWQFLLNLLNDPSYSDYICWIDQNEGKFKFVSSEKVAKLWGEMRGNTSMTYEKLSRAMRYYYKHKVLLPVLGQRLVYKFGPNAKGWQV